MRQRCFFCISCVVPHLWLCLKHLFLPSLPMFPCLPLLSVFCPNWRLKREFYILAASDDERPLITVYPCRWYTAAATWDTFLSFHVSLSLSSCLWGPCPRCILSLSIKKSQSIWTDVLFVERGCKQRRDNVTTSCPVAVCFCTVSHEGGGGEISPHDKLADETKCLFLCVFPLLGKQVMVACLQHSHGQRQLVGLVEVY